MALIRLGLSPLTLGTWQFSGSEGNPDVTWGTCDERHAQDSIHTAFENGVTTFDTAEAYGNHQAERVLGAALRQIPRAKVQILSKFGVHQGAHAVAYSGHDIESALEKSLQALGTDYLDLYQIHWAPNVAEMQDAVATLERAKSTGKIRSYGVSNFGTQSLEAIFRAGGKPSSQQVPYNLLWRAIECEILPASLALGLDVLTYSPLQEGLLSGKFKKVGDVPEGRRRTKHFSQSSSAQSRHGQGGQEELTFETIGLLDEVCTKHNISMASASLGWLRAQGSVSSVIFGASTPDQVRRNVSANAVSAELFAELSSATDLLKSALGPDPDQFSNISRYT